MFRVIRAVTMAAVFALIVSVVPAAAASASGTRVVVDEPPVNQLPDTVYTPSDDRPPRPAPEPSAPPPEGSPLAERLAAIDAVQAHEVADVNARESSLAVEPATSAATAEDLSPESVAEFFKKPSTPAPHSPQPDVSSPPASADPGASAPPASTPAPDGSTPAPADPRSTPVTPTPEPSVSGVRQSVSPASLALALDPASPRYLGAFATRAATTNLPAVIPTGAACFPGDSPSHDATIEVLGVSQVITNTRAGKIHIKVTNTGSAGWPDGTVISYQLYDMAENRIGGRGPETPVGGLAANYWKSFDATVGPVAPGSWYLMWDIYVPGTGWLTERGVCPLSTLSVANQAPSIELVRPSLVDTVATQTPVLAVRGSDADQWPSPSQLRYEFTVCADPGLTSNCVSSGWTMSNSWIVPSGVLQWAQTYYWNATVSDGIANTSLRQGALDPETLRFSVVVPQPEPWRQVGNGLGLANVHGLVLPYGVFVQTARDAQADTANLPLYFERTYSSGATSTEGSMGKGWMTILDARAVREEENGKVTVTYPDGRQETFGRVGDTYVGARQLGMNNRLSIGPSGEVTVVQESGETVYFDVAGRLSKLDYPGSGAWDVSYRNGLADRITQQPSGVGMDLTWARVDDPCGNEKAQRPYVTAVSLERGNGQSPATWRYAYECSRLRTVTDPEGGVSRYDADDYLGANHRNYLNATSPEGRQLPGLARVENWKDIGSNYRERVFTLTEPGSPNRTVRLLAPPASGSSDYYRSAFNSLGGITVQSCDTFRSVSNGKEDCFGYYDTLRFDVEGRLRYSQRADATQDQARYWSYGRDGRLVAVLNENRHGLDFAYDGWGNLASTFTFRDPQTQVTATSYFHDFSPDRSGAVTRVTGIRYAPNVAAVPSADYVNMFSYDDVGRLVRRQGPATPGVPDGEPVTYSYTNLAEPAIDSSGQTIPAATAPQGLIRTKQTAAATATYGYDRAGNLTRYFDGSREWLRSYDARGLITRDVPTDGLDGFRAYAYDAVGRLIRESARCDWDVVSRSDLQRTIDYTYDRDGLLVRRSERAFRCGTETEVVPSRVTAYAYNAQGRLAQVTDPAGGVTRYGYTAADPAKLESTRDARGRLTSYMYSRGRLLRVVADVGRAGSGERVTLAEYDYDPAGRVIAEHDSLGRSTFYDYTWDDLPYRARRIVGSAPNGANIFATIWEREFDAVGRITAEVVGGRRVNVQYDSEGRLYMTTLDPGGLNRSSRWIRDAAGRLSSTERSDGSRTERTSYDTDAAGRVVASHVWLDTATSLTTTMLRDRAGQITDIRDPRYTTGMPEGAFTTSLVYDRLGRNAATLGPRVAISRPWNTSATDRTAYNTGGTGPYLYRPARSTVYTAFGEPLRTFDEQSRETSYEYDGAGRMTAEHLPTYTPPGGTELRPVIRYEYNAAGDVIKKVDQRGGVTDYEYDVAGNLVRETGPEVSWLVRPVTQYVYDGLNRLTSTTAPTGALKKYSYDILGRVVAVTTRERIGTWNGPYDFVTSYSYNIQGDVISVTSASGRTTRFDRNAAGEPTAIWHPGHTQPDRLEYDVAGRVTAETDGAGRRIEHVYDLAGRETSTARMGSDGTRLTTNREYDGAGNVVSETNPRGFTTRYVVDAMNRPTSVTRTVSTTPLRAITVQAGYDFSGNRVQTRNGEGIDTWTTYNSWNLPERVVETGTDTHPDLVDRMWEYSYDVTGKVETAVAPGAVRTTREYDALGRLTREEGHHDRSADPAASVRTFGYDLDGRMTSTSRPGGPLSFEWNDRGFLERVIEPSGRTMGYAHDGDGRVTARVNETDIQNADIEQIGYNADGRVSSVFGPVGGEITWSYDAASGEQAGLRNLWVSAAVSRDPQGRVSGIEVTHRSTSASLQKTTYGYDANDNIVDKRVIGGGGVGGGGLYSYDGVDRLRSWQPRDAQGQVGSMPTQTYGWDDADNLDVSSSSTDDQQLRSFDERGRLTRLTRVVGTDKRDIDVSYSAAGQVSRVISRVGSQETERRDLSWDALGQLTNDGVDSYEYDGLGRLASFNGDTAMFWQADLDAEPEQVPDVHGSGAERIYRDADAAPLMSAGAFGARMLLADLHGDVIAGVPATDQSSQILTNRARFDPFGRREAGEPRSTTGLRQLSAIGFQSDWTNYKTGASWQGARWYDAGLRTYLSRDDTTFPLQGPSSLNLYGYANANPLKYVDPTGRFPVIDDIFRNTQHFVDDVFRNVEQSRASWWTPDREATWNRAVESLKRDFLGVTPEEVGERIGARVLSRWVPGLGWVLTAVDVLSAAATLANGLWGPTSPPGVWRAPGSGPSGVGGVGAPGVSVAPVPPPPRPPDPTVHFERAGGTIASGVDAALSGVVSIPPDADGSTLRPCGLSGTVASCLARSVGVVAGCASASSPMRPCAPVEPVAGVPGAMGPALGVAQDAVSRPVAPSPQAGASGGGQGVVPPWGGGLSDCGDDDEDGVVYRRDDSFGGKQYIGQSKSSPRYVARKAEHALANPEAGFEFKILGRAAPGVELDRLEEYYIRRGGGPTNRGNPDGGLANRRHQMSDSRYGKAGGDPC